MRLIPRHKRTWLLVLIGTAIVAAVAVWCVTSEKSDFERQYDQINRGMTVQEAIGILLPNEPVMDEHWFAQEWWSTASGRAVWNNKGELISLTFEKNSLTEKVFTPLTGTEKLRRLWTHCLKSAPPF